MTTTARIDIRSFKWAARFKLTAPAAYDRCEHCGRPLLDEPPTYICAYFHDRSPGRFHENCIAGNVDRFRARLMRRHRIAMRGSLHIKADAKDKIIWAHENLS